VFEVGLALRGKQELGLTQYQTALMFTECSLVMFVVQAIVFSPWVKPETTRWFIAPALAVLAAGLFLVPRASDFVLMLAVIGAVAASAGILSPILTYWISSKAGRDRSGIAGRNPHRIGETATPHYRDWAKGPRYRRGTRCCWQGRHDQADCTAPVAARSPRGGPGYAFRPRRKAWYFQRYIEHLPVAGEIVLFNRSWYNRAGFERVMEFCAKEEYDTFLKTAPIFEELLAHCGITLVKYYRDISKEEKERLKQRRDDPPSHL
jgi:hypothetical protein